MTRTVRYWAEDGMIVSRFMDPMTEAEALFQLEQLGWLSLNDRREPEAYIARWADLARAIRQAREQRDNPGPALRQAQSIERAAA